MISKDVELTDSFWGSVGIDNSQGCEGPIRTVTSVSFDTESTLRCQKKNGGKRKAWTHYVATSFVVAKRTVVVNKVMLSTNQVEDPLGLVSLAGFDVAILSPISYAL